MQNYRGPGITLTLPAPENTVAGAVVVVEDVTGVAVTDAKSGEPLALYVEGVFTLPKGAGEIAGGKRVYWTGSVVTDTKASNTPLGVAAETAATAANVVDVRLNGAFPDLSAQ